MKASGERSSKIGSGSKGGSRARVRLLREAGVLMPYPCPEHLIAQRFPFLFVKRVLVHRDNGITAEVGLPRSSALEGNGQLHVPLCIAIEMMAQASAALFRLESTPHRKGPPLPGTMVGITNARLFCQLFDNNDLVVESRRAQKIGLFLRYSARLLQRGNEVAHAELTLMSGNAETTASSDCS